jgi:glycosyltransferase involved in cell wall biosynthesis
MTILKKQNPIALVSIIIPTHNRAHLVTRAINSALAAVSPGDEIIVVDDGSTDGTEDILSGFGNSIRYIKTENRGAGAARNLGIQLASNDWIAFLDSDDEWRPDHLYLHRSFLAASEVLFSFSNFDIHYDDTPQKLPRQMQLVSWTGDSRSWNEIIAPGIPYDRFAELPNGRKEFNVHIGSLYYSMLRASYIPAWTSLIRRDIAGELLRFPEDLPTFEDYEYYIRLSRCGAAAYLDCATAINHGHSGKRLTGVDDLTKATTRMVILSRTFGADNEFLNRNSVEYEEAIRTMRILRIKQLLYLGNSRTARRELKNIDGASLFLRMLIVLPGFLARLLLGIRQTVKGKTKSSGG